MMIPVATSLQALRHAIHNSSKTVYKQPPAAMQLTRLTTQDLVR